MPKSHHVLCAATVLAAGTLLTGASAARAAGPLLNVDFDTVDPIYTYGYAYAQAGTATSTGTETAGAGVGGSSGLQITADFTGASGFFSGFGGGLGQAPLSPITSPSSPAEFTYSAAFAVSGLATGTTTPISLQIKFLGPDGPDADTDADTVLELDLDRTLTADGNYQVVSGDFGNATFGSNTTLSSFQQYLANGGQILQIAPNLNLANGNDFGHDADNVLRVDNIQISQVPVPEPSVLGLLAAGGLLAGARRRRMR